MRKIRLLLWPLAVVYDAVTKIRNMGFDWGWLPSETFSVKVLVVGNLNTGGTGKTPMTEYLLGKLESSLKTAVLSRGYGRKTKGFRWVEPNDKAEDAGDEPLQIKQKFPQLPVAVAADRRSGIQRILNEKAETELVLLDDAFQHRYVKPNYAVLLTAYADLFVDDWVLPAGNLRENRSGARRANVVVVTKCPENISASEREKIAVKLGLKEGEEVFFSSIVYSKTVSDGQKNFPLTDFLQTPFTLVTGIASPQTLVDFLREKQARFEHKAYSDHHFFSQREIEDLNTKERILTTEKDFVRLKDKLQSPLFYLPVEMKIIKDEERFFELLKKGLK